MLNQKRQWQQVLLRAKPSLRHPTRCQYQEDQLARQLLRKHWLSAEHQCGHEMKPLLLQALQALRLPERYDVQLPHEPLVLRRPTTQFVHVSLLRQLTEPAMSPLRFLHQRVQPADDQYPSQHLHHEQLIARCGPASSELRLHPARLCYAMCAIHHEPLQQHLMLRCFAPCGRDLVQCAHARTFLLLLAVNRFPAWRLQDCAQHQSVLHAFAQHRLQVLPQHHLQ